MDAHRAEPANVAARLSLTAAQRPDAVAVVEPLKYDRRGRRQYRQVTFQQLDGDSDDIARGLRRLGVLPGMRLALLVRPGIDFIALVFGLFKAGTVIILIDPGMGRRNMLRCLADARPEGFVAIPLVHAVRAVLRRRFPGAKLLVTVGHRWFWGGTTLAAVRRLGAGDANAGPQDAACCPVSGDAPAAIIFTSGGTGPPKGVLYSHGNFAAQVDQIRDRYGIRPGEIDLPCFPLFALFNCAMGVTTVIPDMDPSHPARVDPKKIIEAATDWQATQTFGSPAVWRRVGDYCRQHGRQLPSVRRVLSAGAPVPAEVLERMRACTHPSAEVHTPYGATEALPVASIESREVLDETAARTRQGGGVCVGRRFAGVRWKVIRAVDGPIPLLADAVELPPGEIGELIVAGPQVTRQYATRLEANPLAKIVDGDDCWHRMGDVGYLDAQERFWMCGRLVHRVVTPRGTLYSVCCEAIFNQHPAVARSALVGVGPRGQQRAVVVVEPLPGRWPRGAAARAALRAELRQLAQSNRLTAEIEDFRFFAHFPVDVRHNAKIAREKLAAWAAQRRSRP